MRSYSRKPHRGHPSYEHWNVTLWMYNDAEIYNLARSCRSGEQLVRLLAERGRHQTGDGVQYTADLCDHALRIINN